MSASGAPAVRRFRFGGGGDDDSSSSSEDNRGRHATHKRAAAAIAAPPTATAALQSKPRPRVGSSSSLELSTSSAATSRSAKSPSRSALPAGLQEAMAAAAATTTAAASASTAAAAAAAVRPVAGSQVRPVRSRSSSSGGDEKSISLRRVVRPASASHSASDGAVRTSAAAAGGDAVSATGSDAASVASPNASAAAMAASSRTSLASSFFFKAKNASPTVVTDLTVRFPGPGTSAAAVAVPASAAAAPAAPLPPPAGTRASATATAPASLTGKAPTPSVDEGAAAMPSPQPPPPPPAPCSLAAEAPAAPPSVAAPSPAPAAVRAELSAASTSSDDDAAPAPALAPRRRSTLSSLSSSDVSRDGAVTAATRRVVAIRKLTVPISVEGETGAGMAGDNEAGATAASPRGPWQPSRSTLAVGSPVSSAMASFSSPHSRAAPASPPHPPAAPPRPVLAASPTVPRDGVSAALSGPGSVAYSRVSVQGRGSVPASVLAAPSGPKRRTLPSEHKSSAAPSAAPLTAAAPSSPPHDASSSVRAASSLPGPERAAQQQQQPPPAVESAAALPRPHRQAPRLPGATHTSAGAIGASADCVAPAPQGPPPRLLREATTVSLIEDDGGSAAARRRGSSPSAAATPLEAALMVPERAVLAEDEKAEVGRPHVPSASASAPPMLSRAAAATAAQREWEAALTVYDDRVPPAERHSRRQALPVTGPSVPARGVDPITACLLKELRRGGTGARNTLSDPAAAPATATRAQGRGGPLGLVGQPVLRLGGTRLMRLELGEQGSVGDVASADGEEEADEWPRRASQPTSSVDAGRAPVVGRRYSAGPRPVQRLPAATQSPSSPSPHRPQQPNPPSASRGSAADPSDESAVALASAEWRALRRGPTARDPNAVPMRADSGVATAGLKAALSSLKPALSAASTSAHAEDALGVDLLNYRGSRGRLQPR